jgi:glycosyltransferase 2 family protein
MGSVGRQLRRWSGLVAKVAVSALVLALVLRHVDLAGLGHSLAATSASGLAVAGAAFLAIPLLGGLRWWSALRGIGQPARLGSLSAIFSTVAVVAQVLPSVAADGVRVWLAVRRGHALAPTVQSVLLERVFMVLAVLALALGVAPLLAARTGEAGPVWICAALLLAGLAGLGALMLADRIDFGLPRLRPWRAFMAAAPATRRLVLSRWGTGLALGSLVSNLNFALAAFLLGRALGLPTTAADFLAVMPAVTLATTLPISFGGWGVREGMLVLLLGHVGVAPSDALALSLLFGVGNALCGVPGLALWAFEGRLGGMAQQWHSRRYST